MKLKPAYVRNIFFGVEDSLVSTVGVLYGIASAGSFSRFQLLLTGLIVISVEAMSMGAGAFLADSSEEEYTKAKHSSEKPLVSGILMFTAYFLAGIIPIFPYTMWDADLAKNISLVLSAVALFFLGYSPTKNPKSALKTMLVGGLAIGIGFVVSRVGIE